MRAFEQRSIIPRQITLISTCTTPLQAAINLPIPATSSIHLAGIVATAIQALVSGVFLPLNPYQLPWLQDGYILIIWLIIVPAICMRNTMLLC